MSQNNEKHNEIEELDIASYPWSYEFVEGAPFILASLYKTLRLTLEKSGFDNNARHTLKDLLIGMIKFPVLTILSQVYEDPLSRERFSNVLLNFIYMYGNKTDGKWLGAARNILELAGEGTHPVIKILNEVVDLFVTYDIVNWRNIISHESSVMTGNDVNKFKTLLFKILEHFYRNQETYCGMKLFLMDGKKRVHLNGADNNESRSYSGKDLYLEIDGKTFPLLPLIINLNNDIYYYDTFIKERRSVQYAKCTGKGKISRKDEKFWQIYLGLKKMVRHAATEESAEDDIFIREQMEEAEEIAKPDYLIRFQHIIEQLALWHNQHSKGIFLLQMEDGMGKTTMVKTLDGLVNGETYKISANMGKKEHEIVSCRAFYVNSVYAHSPKFFVQELTDSLRKSDLPASKTLTGELPTIDMDGPNAKIQVAELINRLTEIRKKKFGIGCQFIFVDGIDEIPNKGSEKTILSILPEKDMLDDDIYLVLTCRSNKMLSLYTRHILEQVKFDEILCEEHDNPKYVKELKTGIMRRIKDEETAERIIELSGGRALGVIPLVSLVELQGNKVLDNLSGDLFEIFRLEYIDRYYDTILSIAVTLASTPVPLTIGQLSALQDNPAVTFSFLGYISELKPVTDIQNTTAGRLLIISRPEVRERLKKENAVLNSLVRGWQQALKDYFIVLRKENEKLDESVEETYLLRCILVLEYFLTQKSRLKMELVGLEEPLGTFLANYISHRIGRLNWRESFLIRTVVNQILVVLYKRNKEFGLRFSFQLEGALLLASEQLLEVGDTEAAKEVLKSIITGYEKSREKRKEISSIIKAYSILGRLFMMAQEPEEATKCFKKQNELYDQVRSNKKKKSNFEEELAELLFDWDAVLHEVTFQKNYEKISLALDKGKKLEDQLNDFLEKHPEYEYDLSLINRRLRIFKTMGNIYKKNISEKKATEYFKKLRRLLDQIKPMFPGADFRSAEYDYYLNMGQHLRKIGKAEDALTSYKKSLEIIQELKIDGKEIMSGYEARVLNSLSNLALDRKDYKEAKTYAERAIDALEAEKKVGKELDRDVYANLCGNLAEVYEANGDQNKAEEYWNKNREYSQKRTDYISKEADNRPGIHAGDTVLVKTAGVLEDKGKIYIAVEDFVKKATGVNVVCVFETYICGRKVDKTQREKNKGIDVLIGKCFANGKLKNYPLPYIQLEKEEVVKRIWDLKNIEEFKKKELVKRLDKLTEDSIIVGDGADDGEFFVENSQKITNFMQSIGDGTIPWEYTVEIRPQSAGEDTSDNTESGSYMIDFSGGGVYIWCYDYCFKKFGFPILRAGEIFIPQYKKIKIPKFEGAEIVLVVNKTHQEDPNTSIAPMSAIGINKIQKRINEITELDDRAKEDLLNYYEHTKENTVVIGTSNTTEAEKKLDDFITVCLKGAVELNVCWDRKIVMDYIKLFQQTDKMSQNNEKQNKVQDNQPHKPATTRSDKMENTKLWGDVPMFAEGGVFSWCYDYGIQKFNLPILKTTEIFIPHYKGIGMVLVVNMNHENDPKAAAIPMAVIGINEIRNRISKKTELDDNEKKDILKKYENTEDDKVVIGISKEDKTVEALADHIQKYLYGANELTVYWDRKAVINFMKINHFI